MTDQAARIRRIAAGEYVTVNTLPVVQFSRLGGDRWVMAWGKAAVEVHSKQEGARLVRELAALSAVAKLDNPLRFTSPNGSGPK